MGITIAYRGRLADLTRVEDFEDRLLDFALEVGGKAQIWRTTDDDDPRRMVRGVILNVAPGQEPVSLLLSPEGWLVGLMDIEDAERGQLAEPPWCFTKTQFGPLEGHVAIVEMLTDLRHEFLPDLEVSDEGGYYQTRDLAELQRRFFMLREAIEGMAEGLRRHGLSSEAAEDPEIVVRRIERIAAQVHRILRRPAEHPPVQVPEDGFSGTMEPKTTEALRDELFKLNRRQQERQSRREADQPLFTQATALLTRLHETFRDAGQRDAPSLHSLFQGAGDVMSGLAQALSGHGEEEGDADLYGLRVVQLTRALRGAALARGSLYSLRSSLTDEQSDDLHGAFKQLEQDIFQELSRLRSEHRGDEE